MQLFDNFKETIFLKEDSDLEKQLEDLKAIRDKQEDTSEIDKEIKKLEYGIEGEKQIAFELKNAHIGMYVLHDVTFECDGNKAQIDYLLFTRGYFYIIECKNLYGNIIVDKDGQFYREIYGRKESIYSPYTQAVRHQDMMKKVWEKNHNKLDNYLFANLHGKNFFRPIVVLSNSKSYLNKNYAPREIKDDIIRTDQLISYIEKDLQGFDRQELVSEKRLKKIAEIWLSRSTSNDTNIANKYISLGDELREFRKEKSKDMNVPAYYVFNDDEMSNLIAKKPKTIEELKESGILPEIKIKCHGEDIINILNKRD